MNFTTPVKDGPAMKTDWFYSYKGWWMETDPSYEYEAPKWFDFTVDFESEINDNTRWVVVRLKFTQETIKIIIVDRFH